MVDRLESWSTTGLGRISRSASHSLQGNIDMSSHSRIPGGSVIGKWLVLAVVFGSLGTMAAAQDQAAPHGNFTRGIHFSIPQPMCTACFLEVCCQ